MTMLFVDLHEPERIGELLMQTVPDTILNVALNSEGKADYWWRDIKTFTRQWERKQTGEAIADLDAVEEQLN
ncbi:hypothetical protein LCGC14_2611800, partial [marine sediment metagenome]